MINLYKPSVYSDDIKEVVKQLKNGSLSGNTSIVKSFEEKLGNYLNSKYCLVTSNGTTALHLALLGSGIKELEIIYDSYPSDIYNYKMEVHDLSLNCYSNNRLVDTHTLTLDDFPLYFKVSSIYSLNQLSHL